MVWRGKHTRSQRGHRRTHAGERAGGEGLRDVAVVGGDEHPCAGQEAGGRRQEAGGRGWGCLCDVLYGDGCAVRTCGAAAGAPTLPPRPLLERASSARLCALLLYAHLCRAPTGRGVRSGNAVALKCPGTVRRGRVWGGATSPGVTFSWCHTYTNQKIGIG